MRRLAPLLFLVMPLTTAIAQSGETDREIRYEKRGEIDFEKAIEIDGVLLKPAVKLISTERRKGFNPLIVLRSNFDAEMASSVDCVK